MKKKLVKIISAVIGIILVIWAGMLITDTFRSQNLSEPVFAKEIRVKADENTIVYQGLGYTVESEYFTNENGESYVGGSEVYLFGKLVAAVIT